MDVLRTPYGASFFQDPFDSILRSLTACKLLCPRSSQFSLKGQVFLSSILCVHRTCWTPCSLCPCDSRCRERPPSSVAHPTRRTPHLPKESDGSRCWMIFYLNAQSYFLAQTDAWGPSSSEQVWSIDLLKCDACR
ncbi:hypothetical protein CPSG_09536 [Coccidioides posadasii str. Silveira]|uniref:Uncharacterized protein n=1 Tax=Coccidioides posadasii (strain RMSCC 757 / Silveira) TaxID=443226 RepID=E9DI87_COCPS|nr:hypothetical protein CPSG_09536 [Coccidioides posadasii str. Silveira]